MLYFVLTYYRGLNNYLLVYYYGFFLIVINYSIMAPKPYSNY